jgi:DNA polymerase IIIc chi subunit
MQHEAKKMEKNMEIKIAFKIWNQLNQLDSILWDRYRDEFLSLTIEQDNNDCSQDDNQDVDDLF